MQREVYVTDPVEHEKRLYGLGLQSIDRSKTFDSYQPKNDSQQQACLAIQELLVDLIESLSWFKHSIGSGWAAPRASEPQLIVLSGSVGTGKTHLLQAAVNDEKLRQWTKSHTYSPASIEYTCRYLRSFDVQLWKRAWAYRPLLLIDDLFRECEKQEAIRGNWIRAFCELVDYIYEQRVVTVVTTNYSLDSVIYPAVDEFNPTGRTRSRLEYMTTEYQLTGPDHRQQRKATIKNQKPKELEEPSQGYKRLVAVAVPDE